jgi:hypothetical protein
MRLDVKSVVIKGITELRRTISGKTSELASLKQELERYETALKVLSRNNGRPVRRREIQSRGKTDWNAVFKRLPDAFTSQDFRSVAAGRNKSAVYLRHILSTWTKRRKIKRVARGKYRKV